MQRTEPSAVQSPADGFRAALWGKAWGRTPCHRRRWGHRPVSFADEGRDVTDRARVVDRHECRVGDDAAFGSRAARWNGVSGLDRVRGPWAGLDHGLGDSRRNRTSGHRRTATGTTCLPRFRDVLDELFEDRIVSWTLADARDVCPNHGRKIAETWGVVGRPCPRCVSGCRRGHPWARHRSPGTPGNSRNTEAIRTVDPCRRPGRRALTSEPSAGGASPISLDARGKCRLLPRLPGAYFHARLVVQSSRATLHLAPGRSAHPLPIVATGRAFRRRGPMAARLAGSRSQASRWTYFTPVLS